VNYTFEKTPNNVAHPAMPNPFPEWSPSAQAQLASSGYRPWGSVGDGKLAVVFDLVIFDNGAALGDRGATRVFLGHDSSGAAPPTDMMVYENASM
jgi:hypothetical protein